MLEEVIEIIRDQLELGDDIEITEDTSFKDDLGIDSLDFVELVMAFESEYGMEVPAEELENIKTVGDACECIKANMD
jgi:acyl carrier protein